MFSLLHSVVLFPLIVEITMTGLHVVLCVEYLLQLAQFCIQGMSVVPERSSTATSSGL